MADEDSETNSAGTSKGAIIKAGKPLEKGDSLESGDYTLSRQDNGDYVLSKGEGADKQLLWGYSGSGDPFSSYVFDFKLGRDGSIKSFSEDGEVMETVIASGLKPHFQLILLHHPKAEVGGLKFLIDNAQNSLQMGLDLTGSGHASDAPDLSKWLHDKGLIDKVNSSEMIKNYGDKVSDIASIKEDFKNLDKEIDASAYDTKLASSSVMDDILTKVDELNDQLIAADNHVERAEIDATPQVKAHLPEQDRYYDRIEPDLQERIEHNILTKVDAVEKLIRSTLEGNRRRGGDITDKGPKTPRGSGEEGPGTGSGPGPGPDPGVPTGATTPGGLDTEIPEPADSDFSEIIDDLLGGDGDITGEDSTTSSIGNGVIAVSDSSGTAGNKSATIDALIERLGAAGSGAGVANQAANSGGTNQNSASGQDSSAMMWPMMMSMMNRNGAAGTGNDKHERELEKRERELEKRERELQQGGDPNAAATATATEQIPGTATVSAIPSDVPVSSLAGSNSMTEMTLPDGSTQKMSSVAAEAIHKEMSNLNGADATAAYQGTAGASTPSNPWSAVDSANVHTGDVVQWSNRSALIVVNDAGLQFLLNGQLVPLDPNNPPDGGQGDYGTFQGYFHPSGVDRDNQLEVPQGPTSVVAPHAAPAAPPPVSPPAAV
ncbi:hypothetical protein [Nocardia callitridis]|uniref:Uncharacterized protein n=1 Tax=Nocardia callitridis TaxID=648753 RepID=A0ABP9KRE4_9NOCA